MLKVEVIDSCPIFTRGLTAILTAQGFRVLEHQPLATDPKPAREADLVLVDPSATGDISLADFVADATGTTAVLVVGTSPGPAVLRRYLAAGAAGFIERRAPADSLVTAVRTVARGGEFWSTVDRQDAGADGPERDGITLSPRERQVLQQIAEGLTHNQVARRLGISPHTVDTYVKRVRVKLKLGNKAELTRAAVTIEAPSGPAVFPVRRRPLLR
ncbi:response regulator transcription factor [Plantactinospora sp. BB1]|uniref:response regulator transcription factor n=1 Tax=Plantactinospora sp. BB1 TaxID=2071627 RepID=UPI0018FEF6EF|nr:response regulator transcription factor [Plantactinospora sp. BB1]